MFEEVVRSRGYKLMYGKLSRHDDPQVRQVVMPYRGQALVAFDRFLSSNRIVTKDSDFKWAASVAQATVAVDVMLVA